MRLRGTFAQSPASKADEKQGACHEPEDCFASVGFGARACAGNRRGAAGPASVSARLGGPARRPNPVGALPPGAFAPRISPDGRRVAFDTDGSVWIAELANLAMPRRFAAGRFPMWSPDGTRLLFSGPPGFQLFWQASDGTGTAELIAGDTARAPESWSTALGLVSYITLTGGTDYDIWAFSPGDRSNRAIVVRAHDGADGQPLLARRQVARVSIERDRPARDLRGAVPAHRRAHEDQRRGRRAAVWSPDGREIFYDKEATLYAAAITATAPFTARPPVALPIKGFVQGTGRRLWDLAPDGTRFLMMFP